MNKTLNLDDYKFAPVIRHNGEWKVLDLTDGYDIRDSSSELRGIGRYNEKRKNMYTTPLFEGGRNIHIGIDLWAPAGEPVYAFFDGEIAYAEDNNEEGNYGPTIVTRHLFNETELFALYGHLSRESLNKITTGQNIAIGEKLAELGGPEENGGWAPHLHFQLSLKDPGKADMPGVVAEENRDEALQTYPDPRLVLGELY